MTPVTITDTATTSATAAPIPAGVNAGLHSPLRSFGVQAWGIVLMLLGGAGLQQHHRWRPRRRPTLG